MKTLTGYMDALRETDVSTFGYGQETSFYMTEAGVSRRGNRKVALEVDVTHTWSGLNCASDTDYCDIVFLHVLTLDAHENVLHVEIRLEEVLG